MDIKQLLIELVKVPSDTATTKEQAVEKRIYDYLHTIAGLEVGLQALPKDPFGRHNVYAFYKGSTPKTLMMIHHHDIVDVLDYGTLQEVAHDPLALQEALRTRSLSREASQDLESGQWLFGRGTADMKAGAAIQMKLLERLVAEGVDYNILLLSVADEETLSSGMRQALYLIEELKDKHHIDIELVLNCEPHNRDEAQVRTYADGSVGKSMLCVYAKGIKSHIGEIDRGFNPLMILSEILLATEISPELRDQAQGVAGQPPSWSFMRDFKEHYDASIPESCGGYLSFLTMTSSPAEILEKMRRISEQALRRSLRRYEESFGHQVTFFDEMEVLTFEELSARIPHEISEHINAESRRRLAKGMPAPETTLWHIEQLMHHLEGKKPRVILAFTPPYYPHVANQETEARTLRIRQELKADQRVPYFMGLSDLSYVTSSNMETDALQRNMPLWHEEVYSIHFTALAKLHAQVLNLGPWGKDLHQWTERVYLPDVEHLVEEIHDLLPAIL